MFPSIEHDKVRFIKGVHLCVTIDLHLAHDAKCFDFCILVFPSKTIRQFYFITKMPTFGLYEYKAEGSGSGFNRKRGLAGTDLL